MTAASGRPKADERPILGTGRGRIIALAVAVGAALPVAAIHRWGDDPASRWAALQRTSDGARFWEWAAVAGSPGFWLAAAVVGFGVAAGMNWGNTARWTGVLLLGIVLAALANIAVIGEARGAATCGAVACVLTLSQPRGWPFWAAAGGVLATARLIATGAPASEILVSALLGTLGVLVVEYGWHTVAPDAPPRRGADPRS